jgi:CubicO group peptidase (beta-lactamase class C family)
MNKLLFIFAALVLNCFASAQNKKEINAITNEANDSIPSLGSVLVWKDNTLISENYFHKANSETQFNVKSVTKSIVSALTGIAKDRGLLPDLNARVISILPEYDTNTSANKKKLSLRDLLTMQTGIIWDDNDPPANKNKLDYLQLYLNSPFDSKPGTKFRYSTPASHLMGVAVSQCIKANLKTFADSVLFAPVGVIVKEWPSDKLGHTFGGSELQLKANDLLKFGLLYLNEGKVNDKQIISSSWIKESTGEQVVLNEWDVLPGANGYGYFWWRRKTNGHQAYVASGYGGQLICVIPDLKMVIVTTCFVNDKNRGRSEIKRLHGFIDRIVKELD